MPRTTYRKKPPHRKVTQAPPRSPRWALLVTVLGAVLAIGSAAGMVSTNYLLGRLTQNIETTSGVLQDRKSVV